MQIILNKEKSGIERYKHSVASTRQLVPAHGAKPEQSHSDAVELYKEAASVKPDFDRLVKLEICKRFRLHAQRSGSKVNILCRARHVQHGFEQMWYEHLHFHRTQSAKRMPSSVQQEELEVHISPKLKRMTRMIEKTLLKGRDSVAHVKDIVRAMAVVRSMDAVASILDIFCELHKAGLITMVRVKERFLEAPSKGGWRGAYRQ